MESVVLLAGAHLEGPTAPCSLHGAEVLTLGRGGTSWRDRLSNAVRHVGRGIDVVLAIDYRPSYLPWLMALPFTPTVIWVRDPRTPGDWARIRTLQFPKGGAAPAGVGEIDTHSLGRFVRKSRVLRRPVLLASKMAYQSAKIPAVYGLPPSPHVLCNPDVVDYAAVRVAECERPRVISLARLDPIKRPWLFVELARRFPDVEFLMAGQAHFEGHGGWQPTDVPQNLRFVGHVEGADKDHLLSSAWVLVNTSIHEESPVSLFEALAYETPLLSTIDSDRIVERHGVFAGRFDGAGLEALPALTDGLERLLAKPTGGESWGEPGDGSSRRRITPHASSTSSGCCVVRLGGSRRERLPEAPASDRAGRDPPRSRPTVRRRSGQSWPCRHRPRPLPEPVPALKPYPTRPSVPREWAVRRNLGPHDAETDASAVCCQSPRRRNRRLRHRVPPNPLIVNPKRFVNDLLARWGYEIRTVDPLPVDARGAPESLDAVFHEHGRAFRRPFVADVPVERLRGLNWFPYSEERHPFMAALAAFSDGGVEAFQESPLADYYETYRPTSAADVLGLTGEEAPVLAQHDALSYCMPWHAGSPDVHRRRRVARGRREAREHGVNAGADDGDTLFGPVSLMKGQLEMDRLLRVFRSIRSQGYRRHPGRVGDVGGVLYLGESPDWCVAVTGGQHRVAAAAALGYRSLPVRFSVVPVRRGEAGLWPQVRAGRVGRAAALAVFDRVLEGRAPTSWTGPARSRPVEQGHPRRAVS